MATACIVTGAIATPTAASAAPPFLWQTPPGTDADSIQTARGLAAGPVNGHVYVSDQAGDRIVELGAWGELVRMWGWDVVETGPGDDTIPPEDQFEICEPEAGDLCKDGAGGTSGAGQFNSAAGIAIDSEGNVYAAETGAPRRVQKFSSTGEWLLSFGGGVNQGGGSPENPGNVCTKEHIDNGDACGAGETGAGSGEFSGSTGSLRTVIGIDRQGTATAADDDVWVGDNNRVQRFDTQGVHQGDLAIAGEAVQQLTVDSAGSLYVSYEQATNDAKPNVFKLHPGTGAVQQTFAANNPRAITVAPGTDGDVYVFDKEFSEALTKIRHFDSGGGEVEAFGEGLSDASIGLATGSGCGVEGHDIYFANNTPSFVRAFGPPPDPDVCPRPAFAPEIADQFAADVGITSATAGVLVNPRFYEDTTYFVEYGTEQCIEELGWVDSCTEEKLAPGATLTDELTNEPVRASVALSSLVPDADYLFRFLAQSSGSPDVAIGPGEPFRTFPPEPDPEPCSNDDRRIGPGALLPDCRAYEMVSPEEKNGGDVRVGLNLSSVEQMLAQAAPGGSKLTYSSSTSFGGAAGAPFASQYIAQRSSGGWSTEPISPPREQNVGGVEAKDVLNNQFTAFSEDLCEAWLFWDGDPPLGEAPTEGFEGFQGLYARDNCGAAKGAYASLIESEPPTAPGGIGGDSFTPQLQGLSADGAHAVYRANDALAVDEGPGPVAGTPGEGSRDQLYEVYDGGKVRLVSVCPAGSVDPLCPAGAASPLENTAGSIQDAERSAGSAANAVSVDGSRIYWTASLTPNNVGTIYLRIDGEETVQASVGGGARFWAAAADGSRALFNEGSQLRVFEEESGEKTVIANGFEGFAGASEDLSRVYLVSTLPDPSGEAPEPDANPRGDVPAAGQPNLFLYEEGQSLAFVGTLAGAEGSPGAPSSVTNLTLHTRLSRVAPDGRHLAFVSRAPLTGYDNTDAASGAADTEVFRYAAAAAGGDELDCVSCNPSGARPQGSEIGLFGRGGPNKTVRNAAAVIPGHQTHFNPKGVLSSEGDRLYFESFDALLPRDTNGSLDVYQWQAAGKGDCDASDAHFFESNGGCIALISSGKGSGNADFIEATPSGEDVFFRTESSLLPTSDNGLIDIYDARVGGGFEPPEPGAAPCEGDACQPSSPAPEFPATSSSGYAGDEALPGPANRCRRPARRAKRISGAAKRARRAARRADAPRAKRRRARRAKGLAKRARRSSRAAKRCRARVRRANTTGRAGR